jgi:hypothetical protein
MEAHAKLAHRAPAKKGGRPLGILKYDFDTVFSRSIQTTNEPKRKALRKTVGPLPVKTSLFFGIVKFMIRAIWMLIWNALSLRIEQNVEQKNGIREQESRMQSSRMESGTESRQESREIDSRELEKQRNGEKNRNRESGTKVEKKREK